ncbi:S8 family serine peptidase [Paraneptunicella aestuarii]|uniref:S8 family serine peptidase n=1 Tax=Paraneptunicella aestuarii TaxID=2831148 RepID=UPI0022B63998|nr:S8 family serine peptidase [Paraneptunicella aestuarii]UAA40638.1 S8 family serine peptidase [Paraneptunicella aestuarii]
MKNLNTKVVGLGVSALSLVAASVMAAGIEHVGTSYEAPALKLVGANGNASEQKQYIVVFKEGAQNLANEGESRTGQLNSISAAGGKFINSIRGQRMAVAKLDKKAYNALINDRNVETISEDPKRYLMAQTAPFGIAMVQADQLSQPNKTARKVCIIDTGYSLGHEDLPTDVTGQANNSQVGSWNNDGHGHGSHVAGTIAGLDNTVGVVGVYPDADLHIVKIFNDSGSWTSASDLITGMQQCADAGANVISMSLGGGAASTAEETAVNNLVSQGILLIAAAGNDGNSTMSYPASYDGIMSVAAVDSSSNVASFSQYNSQVEIAAPGVAVNSTLPGNTYAAWSGTSMATPHVSGVAALVWSFFQQCTNEQIREALQATAQDRGASGKDNFYGWGIVKAQDAYDYLNTWGCDGDPAFPPTGGGGGGGTVDPVSGTLTKLSGRTGAWDNYTLDVPDGAAVLNVNISGGSGDADLYVKYGSQPTSSNYDCRPYLTGNNESCTFASPAAGTYHVSLYAYARYRNVTMNYSYE